ncbi:MAG: 3-deoxy-manno-octulosonate cytidylyltransferase [Chloroflexota bacterium]|nr:3-deoxy-manno-octulosonate cytidylyltransferase [Chloroflexota bacterium]
MRVIGIVPARMGSSRFPGKPLARILGIPMVGHVYFRSKLSTTLDEVYVATCDEEILEYVASIGGKAIMTSDSHERCTDRIAEALEKIEATVGSQANIVVNIQGDEPMLFPEMIDEAVAPLLRDESIETSNLMAAISTREEQEDPNEVKVVVDRDDFALYFSREPIPSTKKGAVGVPMLKQVCIIPFRRDFLLTFNRLEPTPLEKVESVDMLRAIEHGYKVKMVLTRFETHSVDTPEDLRFVEECMRNDPLVKKYSATKGTA